MVTPSPSTMVPLHVGAERTTIADAELDLGWSATLRDDSPLGLENAIAAVEDELARAHGAIAKGAALLTRDAAIRDIASAAGVPHGPEMTLTIEAVEQTFQRLVMRAPGLPAGREFAATLLILREVMHHLEFPSIVIRG
jgi:hypothetical protein